MLCLRAAHHEHIGDPRRCGMNSSDAELQRLLADVLRTRDLHRTQLQGRAGSPELSLAREAALESLEAYVAALELRRWPVPQRMHQDLQLLRALCGHPGDGRDPGRAALTGSSRTSPRRGWGAPGTA
jgi:hypothetical protein